MDGGISVRLVDARPGGQCSGSSQLPGGQAVPWSSRSAMVPGTDQELFVPWDVGAP